MKATRSPRYLVAFALLAGAAFGALVGYQAGRATLLDDVAAWQAEARTWERISDESVAWRDRALVRLARQPR